MTQNNETNVTPPSPPKQSRARRTGCAALVALWFLLLLTPCFCLVLATQGEIAIPQGGAPGQMMRIWLIMDADQRGLGVSSTTARQPAENAVCVESNTRFILWTGSADPAVSCECYERDSAEAEWSLISVANVSCSGD